MPFGSGAWETGDQLLVDVGSRTITQCHGICTDVDVRRESHVSVERMAPRGGEKREGRITFPGKSECDRCTSNWSATTGV